MKDILIYTVHKSALMFIHRLTKAVASEFGVPYYSINNEEHHSEITSSTWKDFIERQSEQGCFAPIRGGETNQIFPEHLTQCSAVLHLRDPRDVLTSLFFSHVYSHPRIQGRFNPSDAEKQNMEAEGIDACVLKQAPKFAAIYQDLTSNLLSDRNEVRLVRYEDMVLNFPEWLTAFLGAFSPLETSSDNSPSVSSVYQRFLAKYETEVAAPASEDVHRHKRQVKPGDHKNKLKPQTIQQLNERFSEQLELLSYE